MNVITIEVAFSEYLHEQSGKGIVIHGFAAKTGCMGTEYRDILKMKLLVMGLVKAQPKARFKPVQLRKVLQNLIQANPKVVVNPTGLNDKTWLRIVGSEVMTLMYQWRRFPA